MHVEILRPEALGPAELDRWRAIQAGHPELGSPFLSPEFAQAVARSRPRTRVAVLSGAGGPPVGFFPFEQTGRRSGRALALGVSDVQGIVAAPTAELDLRAVVRACGLDIWRFDHLLGAQRRFIRRDAAHLVGESSPAVDLSAGWDAYLGARRRSSTFQGALRKMRKLTRERGDVALTFDEPDHASLDWLLRRKSEQYLRTASADRFADPGNRRLVHDLLDQRGGGCAGRLSVLRAGEVPVAAHFGLAGGGQLAWWFPTYEPAFGAYSPGLLLALEIARAMPGEGLALLDLGKGDERYKDRLRNAEIPLLRGAVAVSAARARLERAQRWPAEQAKRVVRASPRVHGLARRGMGVVRRLRDRAPEAG